MPERRKHTQAVEKERQKGLNGEVIENVKNEMEENSGGKREYREREQSKSFAFGGSCKCLHSGLPSL